MASDQEVVNIGFKDIGMNTVIDEFDATETDYNPAENFIPTDPGHAFERPGVTDVLDFSTYKAGAVVIASNFFDVPLPDSNDPATVGYRTYSMHRIWVFQINSPTSLNMDFVACEQSLIDGTFGTIVPLIHEAGGIAVLGNPTGTLLAGFPVYGFVPVSNSSVSSVAECQITRDTYDSQGMGSGKPYISIACGNYPDSRPLIFMFIDRVSPRASFGAVPERYWYFSPENYTELECQQSYSLLRVTSVPSIAPEIDLPKIAQLIPNGVYTIGLFGIHESGETFFIDELIQSINNTTETTTPIIGFNVDIDITPDSLSRFNNVKGFWLGLKWHAGKFQPSSNVQTLYRTWQQLLHIPLASQQAIDKARVDYENALAIEQAAFNDLASASWNEFRALNGGRITLDANIFGNGNTFVSGLSEFTDSMFVAWESEGYVTGGSDVEFIPTNNLMGSGSIQYYNPGNFYGQRLFLLNDTANNGSFCTLGQLTSLDPAIVKFHIITADNLTSSTTIPVKARIGHNWLSVAGTTRYRATFQLWNLKYQCDATSAARVFDDIRQMNPRPRYTKRCISGKGIAYVCGVCNEEPGQPQTYSAGTLTTENVPIRRDNQLMFTTFDTVTNVMRKHWYFGNYTCNTAVKDMQALNIQNLNDMISEYATNLIVLGLNGVEVLQYENDALKPRFRYRDISVVAHNASVVFNNICYAIDMNGKIWGFNGYQDPMYVSHAISEAIAPNGVPDYNYTELKYANVGHCFIDGHPFLVYALIKGITYSAPTPTQGSGGRTNSNIGIAFPTQTDYRNDYFYLLNLRTYQVKVTPDGEHLAGWTRNYGRKATSTNNHLFYMWNPISEADGQLLWFSESKALHFDEGLAYDTIDSGTTKYDIHSILESLYVRTKDPAYANLLRSVMWFVLYGDYPANSVNVEFLNAQNNQNWYRQTSGVSGIIYASSFIGANGWAISDAGDIVATKDNGVSWVKQIPPSIAQLLDVYFVDVNNGWAVGSGGVIFNTTDGGITWVAQTSGTVRALYGVYFVNTLVGWAVGNNGTIIATVNGGTTWTAQTSGITTRLRGVSFVSTSVGWAVGVGGNILVTIDGGTTWTAQTSGTTENLENVKFVTIGNGWAVGYNGTILHTTNAGTTWVAQTSGTTNNLYGVSAIDANNAIAVGDNGTILITTDAGVTWTAMTNGDTNLLYGCDYVDATHIFATGNSGTILYYANGNGSVSILATDKERKFTNFNHRDLKYRITYIGHTQRIKLRSFSFFRRTSGRKPTRV